MILTLACIKCKTEHSIDMPDHQFLAWKNGDLIQRAAPQLTPDQRELLISNICGECWATMFPPQDD